LADTRKLLNGAIRVASCYRDRTSNDIASVFQHDVDRAHLPFDVSEINRVLDAVETNIARHKLPSARSTVDAVNEKLRPCSGNISDTLRSFLRNAIGDASRDVASIGEEWRELLAEVQRVHSLRSDLETVREVTGLIRLDAVLEPTKQTVLDMKENLDKAGVTNQDAALRQASGQAFYNTSKFTLSDLRSRASQQPLRADFEDYLDGFSSNVQDILENFEFRNQIPRLSEADALGTLIEKLVSRDINLSPNPVLNGGRIGQASRPGQSRHGHDLRGTGPQVQRREQRRGRRALDSGIVDTLAFGEL